jgi:hypothetical protein
MTKEYTIVYSVSTSPFGGQVLTEKFITNDLKQYVAENYCTDSWDLKRLIIHGIFEGRPIPTSMY